MSIDPMPSTRCPTAQELRQFAIGIGAPQRIEQIALHLVQSPRCACHEQLAELHTESDDFVQTLREARTANPYEGEAACRAAVRGAAALAPVCTPSPAQYEVATLEGQRLGPYRDLHLLGQGGMGEVYRAFDDRLQRPVALKLIRHDRFTSDSSVRRFRVEAELAARLEHPNIVPVFEVGQEAEHQFLAMKLVEGRPLSMMGDQYRDHPRRAAELMIPLALAIHHAHERQVLHRDLKPGNILIDNQGVPYVTDFGLAKQLGADAELTQSGSVVGTPCYMAPEQAVGLQREVITTTDVYGLGGILYFLLTGLPPIEGDEPLTVLRHVVDSEPVRPSHHNRRVDRDLDTVCLKCLSKDPRRRYATALALAEDLQRWLDGFPIHAHPVPWLQRCVRWCRRRPAVAALTGAVMALALIVAVGSPLVAVSLRRQAIQTRRSLFDSQLSLARAQRLSDRPDRREAGLTAIRGALAAAGRAEVDPATWLRLRNETLACLALPKIRQMRTWQATSVAGSDPTGVLYAYVATDGDIRIRRVSDGRQLARIETSDIPIDPIHFSPAGHYLAVRLSTDTDPNAKGFRLYDVPQGDLKWSFDRPVRWNRVAFTPDERQILLTDFDGVVHRLDTESGKELGAYETGLGEDCELAVHPHGQKIAVAKRQGRGRSIFIHDLKTGERQAELLFPFNVWCLAWSPDGTRLAAGSDGLFSLWDVASNSLLRTFSGHRRLITRISFHPDGRLIATCGYDGATRIWDAQTGELQARFPSYTAYFETDCGQLIIGGSSQGQNALEWWDVELPKEFTVLSISDVSGMFPRSFDISSDGSSVVAAGDDGIRVWDLRSLQLSEFIPLPTAFGVASLPEPGCFLLGSSRGLSELRPHSDITMDGSSDPSAERTADACSLTTLQEGPPEHPAVIHRVAVSQDGHRVAWIRDAGQLVLWDRSSGAVREMSITPNAPCLAVSPSGQWVVSSDADGLAVWDFASGLRSTTLGDTLPWCKATFNADGTRLVVGDEHRYRCWKTAGWRLEHTVPRGAKGLWGAAAFSPDGKILAISSSRSVVKLLSAESAVELCMLPTAECSLDICHLSFSRDAKRLLVAGENHVIQIWDLERIREQLAELGLDWTEAGQGAQTRPGPHRRRVSGKDV